MKYKVWDKKLKKWRNDVVLSPEGILHIIRQPDGFNEHVEKFYEGIQTLGGDYWELDYTDWYAVDNCVLCKCSNFKDKNNTDIYEGDIMIMSKHSNGKPNLVTFKDGIFYANPFGILESARHYGKIVGNIYENPELI